MYYGSISPPNLDTVFKIGCGARGNLRLVIRPLDVVSLPDVRGRCMYTILGLFLLLRLLLISCFFIGDKQTRKLYCRPPSRGLPGVHPDFLLEVNTGVYGLREAPRLWYLAADRKLTSCGWEELKTARSTYVCRDPHTDMVVGLLLLYVDDACYGGSGPTMSTL